jgi:hypothetical protein
MKLFYFEAAKINFYYWKLQEINSFYLSNFRQHCVVF